MNNAPMARIEWVRPEESGRKQLPLGPTYSTVAKFDQQGDQWRDNAWSLVLHFIAPADTHFRQLARVRFLSETGPTHWLQVGSKFQLMEGTTVVAKGTVIWGK